MLHIIFFYELIYILYIVGQFCLINTPTCAWEKESSDFLMIGRKMRQFQYFMKYEHQKLDRILQQISKRSLFWAYYASYSIRLITLLSQKQGSYSNTADGEGIFNYVHMRCYKNVNIETNFAAHLGQQRTLALAY